MISILSHGGVRRSSAPGSACQRNSSSADASILEAATNRFGRAIFFKQSFPLTLHAASPELRQRIVPQAGSSAPLRKPCPRAGFAAAEVQTEFLGSRLNQESSSAPPCRGNQGFSPPDPPPAPTPYGFVHALSRDTARHRQAAKSPADPVETCQCSR